MKKPAKVQETRTYTGKVVRMHDIIEFENAETGETVPVNIEIVVPEESGKKSKFRSWPVA